MNHASLDDNRKFAEGQSEIVERIELERKCRFDLNAAASDFGDSHGLKGHDLTLQLTENREAFLIAPIRPIG